MPQVVAILVPGVGTFSDANAMHHGMGEASQAPTYRKTWHKMFILSVCDLERPAVSQY